MNNGEQEIDDLELIQGYLSGDDGQFTILYERYKSLLYLQMTANLMQQSVKQR